MISSRKSWKQRAYGKESSDYTNRSYEETRYEIKVNCLLAKLNVDSTASSNNTSTHTKSHTLLMQPRSIQNRSPHNQRCLIPIRWGEGIASWWISALMHNSFIGWGFQQAMPRWVRCVAAARVDRYLSYDLPKFLDRWYLIGQNNSESTIKQ
jgi:hypothetical protein